MLSELKWVVAEYMIHLSTSVCPFPNKGKHPFHCTLIPIPGLTLTAWSGQKVSFVTLLTALSHPQAVPIADFAHLVIPLLVLGPLSGCPYTFLDADLLTKKMAPNYFSPVVSSLHASVTRFTVSRAVTWLMSASYVIALRDPSIPSSHLQGLGVPHRVPSQPLRSSCPFLSFCNYFCKLLPYSFLKKLQSPLSKSRVIILLVIILSSSRILSYLFSFCSQAGC